MSQERHVRAAVADDARAVKRIAVETGLLEPEELGHFDGLLSGYLDGTLKDHFWLVAQGVDGDVIGVAYYAPEVFSDRVWNLFFLAVMPEHQATGVGGALIEQVENALRDAGEARARVLIVETSGLDSYEEARIRQFYGPNDDKIVFWKSLID